MRVNRLSLAALCGMFMMIASPVSAGILAYEQFNTDGALVTMVPSPGPGGAWSAHSGAGNKPIQVSGGQIILEQSSGSGEDVNTSFAVQSDIDTTYACFNFSLSSSANAGITNVDGNGLYFSHFSGFVARTGVVAPAGSGDFGLAINADNSNLGAGSTWASDLSFDTTYAAVISYNASTGESKLWLDPVDGSSASVSHTGSSGVLVEYFGLRQSNDYTGAIVIDNVVVGQSFSEVFAAKVPEPTSIALLIAGLIAAVSTRRK